MIETIDELIEKFKATVAQQDSPEFTAKEHLADLGNMIGQGDMAKADQCIAKINDFWLNTVPWCSDLSRDIEKVLIQYEEFKEALNK